MNIRPLHGDDRPALKRLLLQEPEYNLFQLSALIEHGLGDNSTTKGAPWAVGAFRADALTGVVMSQRGTAGLYHTAGDSETMGLLSKVVLDKAASGDISLLSGHASQIDPLLPVVGQASIGMDRCYFQTLSPGNLRLSSSEQKDVSAPRLATWDDMEKLIDFYMVGFYSLARLPSRSAWHSRLSEQLTYRTLFLIEDRAGRVISAAMTSAEGGNAAMLGGVATLLDYRRKGLSTLCVSALCSYLFRAGTRSIALFYLQDNTPASHVYDKVGFQDAGEWLLVPLGFWFT
ncbi:MAG: GNAT family N-acetyltransferase [Chloroflexi bacterium]|nr:GNAT family N-acetyltransferase [Chloroflexota bacterium]